MKHFYNLFFLIACLPVICIGQSFEGKIIDAESGAPISFVNVMFQKSNRGTTSNENGQFKILVRDIDIKDTILISHIGYQTRKYAVSDFDHQFKNIKLEFLGYDLPTVTISDLTAKNMVLQALNSIKQNNPQKKSLITGFYNEELIHEDSTVFTYGEGFLETIKHKYDNKPRLSKNIINESDGKTRLVDGFFEVFHKYSFLDGSNQYSFPNITEGGNIPRLLDLLKSPMSFLLKERLDLYEWEYSGITFDGDRIATIISFQPINSKGIYKGEIIIDDDSKAILASKFSIDEQSLNEYNKKDKLVNLLSRDFKVEYKKTGDYYTLQKVNAKSIFEHKYSKEIFHNKINFTTTDRDFNTKKTIEEDEVILANVAMSNYAGASTDSWRNSNSIQRSASIQKALDIATKRNFIPQFYIKEKVGEDSIEWVPVDSDIYKSLSRLEISLEQLEEFPQLEWHEIQSMLLDFIINVKSKDELVRVEKVLLHYKNKARIFEWLDLKAVALYRKGDESNAIKMMKKIKEVASEQDVEYTSVIELILMDSESSQSENHFIQGKIVNALDSSPIASAYVRFSNDNSMSLSNEDGLINVLIENQDDNDTMMISKIGYETKKISISDIGTELGTIPLNFLGYDLPLEDNIENNALETVKTALKSIELNYAQVNHLAKGFYKEAMKKVDGEIFDYAEGRVEIITNSYQKNPSEYSVYPPDYETGIRVIGGFYEVFYKYFVKDSDGLYSMPDIMKGGNVPQINDLLNSEESFLLKSSLKNYEWEFKGKTFNENKEATIITFYPKNEFGYYNGEIVIEDESNTILSAKYVLSGKLLAEMNEEDYWVDLLSRAFQVDYQHTTNGYILSRYSVLSTFKHKFSGEIFNYSLDYVTTDVDFNTNEKITFDDRLESAKKLPSYKGKVSDFYKKYAVIKRSDKVQEALDQAIINRSKNLKSTIIYAKLDSQNLILDYGNLRPEKVIDAESVLSELESAPAEDWRKVRGALLTLILEAKSPQEIERLGLILLKYRTTAISYEWLDLRALILYKQGKVQKAFIEQQEIIKDATNHGIKYRSALQQFKDEIEGERLPRIDR